MKYEDVKGAALPMTALDYDIVAGYLGCEVAALKAVVRVESAGKGFGSSGRPIMRFEGHIFYRELSSAQRDYAVKAGLASKNAGVVKNPKLQTERYQELLKPAMLIDSSAALRSCSWGLGQVMGFNWDLCGFKSVLEFVAVQCHSEGAQLMTMARFIVNAGLQRELKDKQWAKFAEGYNGKDFRRGDYHTKLATAYAAIPAHDRYIPKPATQAEIDAVEGRGATKINGGIQTPKNPQPAQATGYGWLWAILHAIGVVK